MAAKVGDVQRFRLSYRAAVERKEKAFAEPLVKRWLAERGVPVPEGAVARNASEAVKTATRCGYPVVVKLVSGRMLHKTEVGAVMTGIATEKELRAAFRSMDTAAREVEGAAVLVEAQIPEGVEVIVGLQYDPHFGPVLMVGTGGVMTDLLEDVVFRMLPVTKSDIKVMLADLKGAPLLKGFRGSEPVNLQALVEVIEGIAKFGMEVAPFMESADFNPVIANRRGAWVVDAKITLARQERSAAVTTGRPRTAHLDSFFSPKSVAVVGASATTGKIGNVIVDSLAKYEYKGKVYPINPNRTKILGVKCYPALSELPEKPELVVMVVDLERGPALMHELGRMGVHNLLIVSGGGKELGGDREALEKEMARLSGEFDIRVVGPNCIGAFDGVSRFDSFFHHHDRLLRPPAGKMSFITQSGTWGCAFLEAASVVGVSKMVSYGNRVDVDEGDLITYLAEDRSTAVIGSYLEGLSDGRKFLAAARDCVKKSGKPVVVFKTGRTPRAAKAAVSHTGAYGGTYKVYEGVFEQFGVLTADSIEEQYSMCKALAMQPAARGPRAAMVSNGAGPMVNALDLFAEKGLEAVKLSRGSVEKMRRRFSFFYLVENPVDVTGSASAEDYEFVIRTLLADEKVDVIMPFFVFQDTPLDESIVERMDALGRKAKKPIVACAVGGPYTKKMTDAVEAVGVPVTPDVAQWVAAASALVSWGKMRGKK